MNHLLVETNETESINIAVALMFQMCFGSGSKGFGFWLTCKLGLSLSDLV